MANEDNSRVYEAKEDAGTGWFVGIIVALALLAIGYLVFSAPSRTTSNVPAAVVEQVEPSTSN